MACRLCEVHCLVAHSKSKKIIKAYKDEFPRALPRVIVEHKGPISFALQCRHCEDAPCVKACLTGAMSKGKDDETINHDQDKCVGCWMCVMVCPFGVIRRDVKEKKVATKCDMCKDEKMPVCVEKCPNEALVLIDDNDAENAKSR